MGLLITLGYLLLLELSYHQGSCTINLVAVGAALQDEGAFPVARRGELDFGARQEALIPTARLDALLA